jgi:NADH-quinone oxidoreductase subunit G
MLNIEIDGKKLQVQEGSMIIEAADAAGIYIPRFCYHKKLSVAANCRMCLVDVEKAAKPLPACATPVTEGMRVFTHSEKTVNAQRGVMEFLLINHPLDCPICDQGGECDLQDLAVGYGKDVSRYQENKRIVKDKNLGPLISTDMTRCIHCTRCVRFGQEIAGIMELGATGRGEHTRIGTYVERTVDSELSGNMIDLCPVGALTSKPFRYSARTWELTDMPSVSPHDCVGANVNVQVRRNKVMRVLPRENEDINETWISDRDRFSYEALNSEQRLQRPRIRVEGQWRETDWRTALDFTVTGLRKAIEAHGAEQLGAIAAPQSTVEEFYLLQKLVRALGSNNVDHRLRQRDFSDDGVAPLFPGLGQSIRSLETLDRVLLIGSNVRKEQPLIGHRVRKAFLNGAKVMAVNPVDYDFTFSFAAKAIRTPAAMLDTLGAIAKALSAKCGRALPAAVANWTDALALDPEAEVIAQQLMTGDNKAVLLGDSATNHPHAAPLRALAELIADLSGAKLGQLSIGNGSGAWLAGCVPHRGPRGAAVAKPGRDAYAMFAQPLKAYVVLGAEPELESWDARQALQALQAAEFVVSLSSFKTGASEYAHVQLPISPFTETSGTFVNCEGRWQSFSGAVAPLGETRPAWKVLRVLGNMLSLPGFEYNGSEEVLAEVRRDASPSAKLTEWRFTLPEVEKADLVALTQVSLYLSDALVRRSTPLVKTTDHGQPCVRMNTAEAGKWGVSEEQPVWVQVGSGGALLELELDASVPNGEIVVAGGFAETAALSHYGSARVSRG